MTHPRGELKPFYAAKLISHATETWLRCWVYPPKCIEEVLYSDFQSFLNPEDDYFSLWTVQEGPWNINLQRRLRHISKTNKVRIWRGTQATALFKHLRWYSVMPPTSSVPYFLFAAFSPGVQMLIPGAAYRDQFPVLTLLASSFSLSFGFSPNLMHTGP